MWRSSFFLFILYYTAVGSTFATRPHPVKEEKEECQIKTKNDTGLSSFLWTVQRDPPSYFFGTIHVPYALVWESIKENVKQAFQRSDSIYFELDIADRSTQRELIRCKLLPSGRALRDVIPADLYQRIQAYLSYVRDMFPNWVNKSDKRARLLFHQLTAHWHRLKPIWAVVMLNGLTKEEIQSQGTPLLDMYLAQEAVRFKKRRGAVEEVQDQCGPLNQLNYSQVMFTLNYTLNYLEWLRDLEGEEGHQEDRLSTEKLVQHYRCVQLDQVLMEESSQVASLFLHSNISLTWMEQGWVDEINTYFRQQLIYQRNQRMANTVSSLLQDNPNTSFFFAFGAGHFVGNETVLGLLADEGYIIENNAPDQPLYLGTNYEPRPNPMFVADSRLRSHGWFNMDDIQAHKPVRRRHRRPDSRHETWEEFRSTHFDIHGRHENGGSSASAPRFNNLWQRLYSHRTSSDVDSRHDGRQSLISSSTSRFVSSQASTSSSHLAVLSVMLLLICLNL